MPAAVSAAARWAGFLWGVIWSKSGHRTCNFSRIYYSLDFRLSVSFEFMDLLLVFKLTPCEALPALPLVLYAGAILLPVLVSLRFVHLSSAVIGKRAGTKT